jgi:putative ABC transport system permease protein
MGLKPASHLRSLVIELGLLLGLAFVVGAALASSAVLLVYRMLDIDPTRPPGPLLTAPVITVIAAAAATLVVALLTAAYAQRAANRADMAEVLRLGA